MTPRNESKRVIQNSSPGPLGKHTLFAAKEARFLYDRLDKWFQSKVGGSKRKLPVKQQLQILARIESLLTDNNLTLALHHLKAFSKREEAVVYGAMISSLQSGGLASSALSDWFDQYIVQGLAIAEERGTFGESLAHTVKYLSTQTGVLTPILWSLLSPSVVLLLVLLIPVFVSSNLIPLLEKSGITRADLSLPLQVLLGIHDFTTHMLAPLAIVLAGAIAYLVRYIKYDYSTLRLRFLDDWIIFREFRLIMSSRFLNMFTHLLQENVKEAEALHVIRKNDTRSYLGKHIMTIEGRIRSGARRSTAFDTGLFDKEGASLILAMADSSNYRIGLKKVADESQRRYLQNIGLYAFAYKVVAYVLGAVMGLCVYGSLIGLEELFLK